MKNYKNYISLGILILVLCGIIFAFSEISKNNNLTTTPTVQSPPQPNFENIPARTSQNINVSFENNFGGNKSDTVFEVYKFNYYYIVGSSNSTTKYFENCENNTLFLLIINNNGDVKNLITLNISSSFNIVNTKIYENSILILIENNGLKLIEFNMQSEQFNVIFTSSNKPVDLCVSSEPIIISLVNNYTEFYFVNSKQKINHNQKIFKPNLATDYANGTLLFFNEDNQFNICLLTKNELSSLKIFENTNLITFNITEENIVLLTKNNNLYSVIILDYNFNQLHKLSVPSGNNYKLNYLNNQHYLTYTVNNALNLLTFCNHADLLNTTIIQQNVLNYYITMSNNINVVCKNTTNTITIANFDYLGKPTTQTTFKTSKNFEIKNVEIDNINTYTLIGNFEITNPLITQNFGEYDIFICKVSA